MEHAEDDEQQHPGVIGALEHTCNTAAGRQMVMSSSPPTPVRSFSHSGKVPSSVMIAMKAVSLMAATSRSRRNPAWEPLARGETQGCHGSCWVDQGRDMLRARSWRYSSTSRRAAHDSQKNGCPRTL